MSLRAPLLDRRDLEEIRRELLGRRAFYTPEWTASDDRDPGIALLEVAARLAEGIVQRLNEVPNKSFIAFLEMLGIKLLPAKPARVPLTFALSSGASEPVVVDARAQAAGKPADGGDPVIFETESGFVATPAKLVSVVSAAPATDRLFDHTSDLAAGGAVTLFTGGDRQEHSLYLAHEDLFNVEGAVEIRLSGSFLDGRWAGRELSWEYCRGVVTTRQAGKKVETPDFHAFDRVRREGAELVLTKSSAADAFETVEIDGVKSRWIRVTVKGTGLAAVSDLELGPIGARVAPTRTLAPDAAFHNDVELDLEAAEIHPFGRIPRTFDSFYLASAEALSKRGAEISLTFSRPPAKAKIEGVSLGHGADAVFEPVRVVEGARAEISTAVAGGRDLVFASSLGVRSGDTLRIDTEAGPQFVTVSAAAGGRIRTREEISAPLPAGTSVTMVRVDSVEPDTLPQAGDLVRLSSALGSELLLVRELIAPNKPKPSDDLVVTWEYWNGSGWGRLRGLRDGTDRLTAPGTVRFPCPQDLETVEVQGREDYWIRARMTSGDYGRETFSVDGSGNVSSSSGGVEPPLYASIGFGYTAPAATPEQVLTRNSLDWNDRRGAARFRPFVPVDAGDQTLFLGFDGALKRGPLSLFFSFEEQEYGESNRPRVEWQYLRADPRGGPATWARLEIEDGTEGLTESGTVQFSGPKAMALEPRFGRSAYWIRAVDAGSRFQPAAAVLQLAVSGAVKRGSACSQRDPRVAALAALPHPAMSSPAAAAPPAPRLQGLFPNTVWALQTQTLEEEILGSGTGSGGETFELSQSPVSEEEIWVDELGALSDGERAALAARKDLKTRPVSDEAGQAKQFWVLWRPIEDLDEAGDEARVYSIDRTFGEVRFGDGVHGKALPAARDNVVATYRAGGGVKGNLAAAAISSLRSALPLVDGVTNPLAAAGGSDAEDLDRALERGPQVVRHRGRAVTAADFEALAKQASESVARARCLPLLDDSGKRGTNWVTVVVVPQSREPRPMPSRELRRRVEDYLRERAANVAVFPRHVRVIGPAFVEIALSAELFPLRPGLAPKAEGTALARLRGYLHPLTGGPAGRGWEFGRLPCLSDFFSLLEGIEELDHVGSLAMTLQPVSPQGIPLGGALRVTPADAPTLSLPGYALVASGDHQLTSRIGS